MCILILDRAKTIGGRRLLEGVANAIHSDTANDVLKGLNTQGSKQWL